MNKRVLRLVANQSAVAIENARAYTALQQANTELRRALRRSIESRLPLLVPCAIGFADLPGVHAAGHGAEHVLDGGHPR